MSTRTERDWDAFNTSAVVERRGFRSEAWGWRITVHGITVKEGGQGYRCAEDAYAEAQEHLKIMQADPRPTTRSAMPASSSEVARPPLSHEAQRQRRPYRRRIFTVRTPVNPRASSAETL